MLLKNISSYSYNDIVWQLGNEANRYNKFIDNPILHHNGLKRFPDAEMVGKNFVKLRKILKKYNRESNIVIRPEITQPKGTGKVLDFLTRFLSVPGVQSSVDVITMHHYYVNGRTTDLEEVLNPQITFDTLETKIC